MKLNKTLFKILSLTWGLPMNIIGAIAILVCMIFTGKKPKKFCDCYYIKVGRIWGGVSLGMFIITDRISDISCLKHEHGHAIQNCYYGIIFPFIVGIPSVIRYWYREIRKKLGYKNKTKYYDIWFERQATDFGVGYYDMKYPAKTKWVVS